MVSSADHQPVQQMLLPDDDSRKLLPQAAPPRSRRSGYRVLDRANFRIGRAGISGNRSIHTGSCSVMSVKSGSWPGPPNKKCPQPRFTQAASCRAERTQASMNRIPATPSSIVATRIGGQGAMLAYRDNGVSHFTVQQTKPFQRALRDDPSAGASRPWHQDPRLGRPPQSLRRGAQRREAQFLRVLLIPADTGLVTIDTEAQRIILARGHLTGPAGSLWPHQQTATSPARCHRACDARQT